MRCAGPSIVLWDTVLVTGIQLDFVLLIATLWTQFSIYLSVYSYINSFSKKDVIGDGAENPLEIKVDNEYWSPLIYQVSLFIIKGYQDCQTRFPLDETLLATL